MSLIRRIQKFSFIILGVGIILILMFLNTPSNLFAFTIGFLISNLNFFINYKTMNSMAGNIKVFRAVNSFVLRMVLYAILLTLMIKFFGVSELMLAFCGCLSIRIAIVLQELFSKGGYK